MRTRERHGRFEVVSDRHTRSDRRPQSLEMIHQGLRAWHSIHVPRSSEDSRQLINIAMHFGNVRDTVMAVNGRR